MENRLGEHSVVVTIETPASHYEYFSIGPAIKDLLDGKDPETIFSPVNRKLTVEDLTTSHVDDQGGIKEMVNTLYGAVLLDASTWLAQMPLNVSAQSEDIVNLHKNTLVTPHQIQLLQEQIVKPIVFGDAHEAIDETLADTQSSMVLNRIMPIMAPLLSFESTMQQLKARVKMSERFTTVGLPQLYSRTARYFELIQAVYDEQQSIVTDSIQEPLDFQTFCQLIASSTNFLIHPAVRDNRYLQAYNSVTTSREDAYSDRKLNHNTFQIRENPKGILKVTPRPHTRRMAEAIWSGNELDAWGQVHSINNEGITITGCPAVVHVKDASSSDTQPFLNTVIHRVNTQIEALAN